MKKDINDEMPLANAECGIINDELKNNSELSTHNSELAAGVCSRKFSYE